MSKENVIRKINSPRKCIGRKDGKFYAIIAQLTFYRNNDPLCYYLVPWENRLDWERKNIKPEKNSIKEFCEKYRLAE